MLKDQLEVGLKRSSVAPCKPFSKDEFSFGGEAKP